MDKAEYLPDFLYCLLLLGAAGQATRQQAEVLRLQAQTVVSEAHEEVGQTRALAERYAAEVRNRANAEQAQAKLRPNTFIKKHNVP